MCVCPLSAAAEWDHVAPASSAEISVVARNPQIKPALGPISAAADIPPENTGAPIAPNAIYAPTAAVISLSESASAMHIRTPVCRVIPTGVPGMGMRPRALAMTREIRAMADRSAEESSRWCAAAARSRGIRPDRVSINAPLVFS